MLARVSAELWKSDAPLWLTSSTSSLFVKSVVPLTGAWKFESSPGGFGRFRTSCTLRAHCALVSRTNREYWGAPARFSVVEAPELVPVGVAAPVPAVAVPGARALRLRLE